jgi:quinol monooxygenase YgiN
MIYVVATIETAAGQRDALIEQFRRIVELVRAEEGCVEYAPSVDFETNIDAQPELRPDVVTVVEKWASLEHLEAHLCAPHMLEYRNNVKDIVKDVSIQVLEPV